MAQETIAWLRELLDRDSGRLLNTARDAAGTPGGRVVTRLAMDQVVGIQSMRKILDIAEAAGDDPRLGQVVAWLAYARSSAPGYLDTWAPDEIDLVELVKLHDLIDESEE
ncbi:hypothetical protein [Catellatospora methionotrophica]|uniref:hypothetical protein n=1 Tax=Catellatospora methionotrophica TaxID=121620 RepID=UPI00340B2BF9